MKGTGWLYWGESVRMPQQMRLHAVQKVMTNGTRLAPQGTLGGLILSLTTKLLESKYCEACAITVLMIPVAGAVIESHAYGTYSAAAVNLSRPVLLGELL